MQAGRQAGPRSGMFKWMISGHKGHKQKQEKLNNASVAAAINNNNNKNKNNLRQAELEDEEAQQAQQNNSNSTGSLLHIPDHTEINYNNTNNSGINSTNNQHKSSGSSTPDHHLNHHHNHNLNLHQQQQQHTQKHGDVNQNTDSLIPANGVTSGAGNDTPPTPPASRPPPLPTHPPPPVPPHSQQLPQPPMQPLPPLPNHQQEEHRYQQEEYRYQHEEHRYQQEASLQAPGTCILPRRSLGKEEVSARYRSPSNPPPASRQPPPYSRHQPPDPHRRPRGPYQPPPPPKTDFRDSRDHRESRPREVRSSVNLDELQDCRSRRDHWAEGDLRVGPNPRDGQKNCNFREVRETWERRNSSFVPQEQTQQEDNMRSSSLPRPKPEAWLTPNNRWSAREPDSGFDSLNLQTTDDGQRGTEAGQSGHSRAPVMLPTEAHYSRSTEDLLNASRTSPMSLSSASASMSSTSSSPVQYPTIRPAKQPCVTGASHTSPFSHTSPRSSPHPPSGSPRGVGQPHHHSTPVGPQRTASPEGALLSDSVYPQHDTQPRYAEIQDHTEQRTKEERLNHRLSRDLRDVRDVRELGGNRESRESGRTGRDQRDPREPRDNRSSRELRLNKDMKSREYRETSLPRDFRDTREERPSRDVATRGFRELPVDVDERDQVELRQDRLRGQREARPYSEGNKEVKFGGDASESLRVRDAPPYDRRDRDGDGADGLQVNDERRLPAHYRGQRGDGCTSSSVSWMEWTQQLQAYVAWVNSQLRKRGRPLISDLRRDLQSGVVFADLIEIISGERVAGIQREGEREAITPQAMRENLDRILQFMAAKRIRMTHITSKEVAEGNLKSIMRVILALAAHYKPQSVKASSPHQQEPQPAALVCASKHPATHDVSVGPDGPTGGPDKTPNLSANRRTIVAGGSGDDAGGVPGLRRHPSMTATPGAPRDSSPVYENLPRRVAPTRWAYDSLRASHKFQWSGPPSRRPGPASGPNRPTLDESSDDPLNTSLNTSLTISLNTSIEAEVEQPSPDLDSSGGRGNGRPAALNFWQDLTSRRDAAAAQPKSQPTTPAQTPSDDSDNPFRYHTIHRMSGRRKLPQIPGAPNPGNRVTSPQEAPEGTKDGADSSNDRGEGKPVGGSGLGEEGSREPEGRSQNSSPATSLVRGHTLEQWTREKPQLDAWETEDLKSVLRDLNNTRDQLLALQHLELDPSSRSGHGPRTSELLESSTASVKQELLHLSLARQALEAEKAELTRLLEQREGVITELRKQMHQRDKAMHTQRAQFEDALRNVQNGKRAGVSGDSPVGRGGPREELHLVRDAIASLRSNFRETDPNQHTLDTLEQAISILIERSSSSSGGGGGGSSNDKNARGSDQRHQMNGVQEASTKVIYFTERTVTPFMSTINKPLGDIRLRDFKNMFDRPGLFRFHFKSYDPEYGMVKEEIVNDDDILPGVEGKIIAWVEEDVE